MRFCPNEGTTYWGYLKWDNENGWGTQINSKTNELYIGEFESGLRQGKGKLTLADGSVYEGDFY